jgi:hypothetical protein
MYKLEVENKQGYKLELTNNEKKFQIIKIDGLTPPETQIYTNSIANLHGEKFKHSKVEMRNIVITLRLNGDVERNRIELYTYINLSKWLKLYFRNGSRHVTIEGYVEKINGDLFSISQILQISIVCPDPFFKSVDLVSGDLSKVVSSFQFPFSIGLYGVEFSSMQENKSVLIINSGDIEAGLIFELSSAYGTIANPTIYNSETGEFLKINNTISRGETIIINTTKGNKSIIKRYASGTETNIMNSLDINSSTWLQAEVGANFFTYSAEYNADMLNVYVSQNLLYLGV